MENIRLTDAYLKQLNKQDKLPGGDGILVVSRGEAEVNIYSKPVHTWWLFKKLNIS